ncbi:hypothetical protein PI124_g17165 [Phytophthora idaei]|nr:hypothetical protein PI125_g16547 [Phytophthora idaei]KAG3140233.1 hypothetical protein PI126_g16109 [Phytophthora idaei]KAG3237857.1 hypothetical protein PI124_g17165 [Phytophthora idaei]
MKLSVAVAVAACAAAETIAGSAVGVATCSSLNGPFCEGFGSGFAVPPPHARQNLDVDVEELAVIESEKNLKIEKVLKQYELQAAIREAAALEEDEDIGDELKEFFETALDEVLLSVEAALQELSPNAAQGVRTTVHQLKALKDYSTYKFQRLDESQLASIRHKFANHRLMELQQTFERLVIAGDAQDRQLALETAVFLFQLAQEEAIVAEESSTEPEADTTTAVSDVTGE